MEEEIRLNSYSKQQGEVGVVLIGKMKKRSKKGNKISKKDKPSTRKKDLSKVMCF